MKTLSTTAALIAATAALGQNVLLLAANGADGETFTIGTNVFELDTNAAVTAGRIAVDLSGGVTPAAMKTAIVAAINGAGIGGQASEITGGVLFVDFLQRGPRATTETLGGSGNQWLSAATFGVDNGGVIPNLSAVVQRAVTAGEDTGKVFVLALPNPPVAFTVQVRTSAGALKTWDGKAVIQGSAIILYSDGSADLVENDIVAVMFAV